LIQEEIKRRLNSSNTWLPFSHLLSKNLKIRIYKMIILPVVLYGLETWSLTLREEHRLSLFENRVLRRILGLRRDEVTGEWRKLHNEELCDLYSLPSIIRIMKLRSMNGEKPEGKRPLGRLRWRWVNNIKVDLGNIG
jgi:hypothetical protein